MGSTIFSGIIAGFGGYVFVEDCNMKRAPDRQGKILADFHTHPNKHSPIDQIISTLSWGITGLASINGNSSILTYDDAVLLNGIPNVKITEINKGLFAKIKYRDRMGFFFRAQEVMSDHHILAVGIRDQLEDFPDSRKTIEEIHRRGGIAVADHPFVVPTGHPIIKYRLINNIEEERVKELHQMVDESEVFNGQCINLLPVIAWMKRANKRAKKLAALFNLKGTASSDAHSILDQIHTCGIYLPDNTQSIDALIEYIKKGNFERYESYVSKISFIKGHFFS